MSENGEEFEWDFGDNVTATSTSTNHSYKKAGTYIATLTETKSKKKCSHTITVVDSVPNFACDSSVIRYYEPVVFRAKVYNPFKHTLRYAWEIDTERAFLTSKSLTADTICVVFTRHDEPVHVAVTIYDNEVPTRIEQSFAVQDVAAPALLTLSDETAYRQRTYGDYIESAEEALYPEAAQLLHAVQDTMAVYGDTTFYLSKLQMPSLTIQGFMVDAVARKIYFRANGLYVANINLSNVVCLCSEPVTAICVDNNTSRIYYATANGVSFLPLIYQASNINPYIPIVVNTLPSVTKLAIDATNR